MKKLTLELETLAVESFATDAERGGVGTVRAHAWTEPFVCDTARQCKTILTYCPCTPRADGF